MGLDQDPRFAPGPLAQLLGFRLIQADEEGSLVECDPGPEHCNGAGIVHGGYLGALLDSATGWAVHAHVPPGTAAPHIQLTSQFIRIAVPGEVLSCRARCVTAGRRIASTEAEITQGDKIIARGIASHAVLSSD